MIKCPCDKKRRGWEFINEWALWRGAKVCPLSCGLISQRAHTPPPPPTSQHNDSHSPNPLGPPAGKRPSFHKSDKRERGIGDEVLDETWRTHLMSEEWGKDFVVTHGYPDQPAIVAHSDNSNKRNPGSSGWFTFHKESTQSDWPQTNLSRESRLQHLTLTPLHSPPPTTSLLSQSKNVLRAGRFWSVFPKRMRSGSSRFAGVEILFLKLHSLLILTFTHGSEFYNLSVAWRGQMFSRSWSRWLKQRWCIIIIWYHISRRIVKNISFPGLPLTQM